jgi:hypothetical protein
MPQIASKDAVPVGNNSSWHAVQFVDVREEQLGHPSSCEWMLEPHEVSIFGKSVNYDKDTIVATRQGKTFHKVHYDYLPSSVRHRQWL